MNTMKIAVIGTIGVALLSGCFTMSREDVAKEYERLTSLSPAERIQSPCKQVNDVAGASYDLHNATRTLLKEYVAATTNHREYTGFMNDIEFVIKDENLSQEEAMKKVIALVQEEDKNRADADKVWPRIEEGWRAAEALDPVKKSAEVASLVLRNQKVASSVNELPKAYEKEDLVSKAQRGIESGKIGSQLAETAECLAFLGEQYRRVQTFKLFYRK